MPGICLLATTRHVVRSMTLGQSATSRIVAALRAIIVVKSVRAQEARIKIR